MKSLIIADLHKSYGSKKSLKHALDGINLEIQSGIFGLLGPNGAGKTTLMKCIVTLIDDYEGTITLDGVKWNKDPMKNETIGYVPQKFSLFKQLTVYKALEYVAVLKNVENSKDEIERVLESVNLKDEKDKKMKSLSGGMLRRVGIAQALLGNPKVLVIDEPTAGLDPKERVRFRNILMKLPKDIIVILSTHIVEDLSLIANNIAIISNGKVLIRGYVQDILQKLNGKVGTIDITGENLEMIENRYKVTSISKAGNHVIARIVGDALPNDAEAAIPTLEDAYFYFTGDKNE